MIVLYCSFLPIRFSSIIKTPGIRRSKEKKDAVRLELKRIKEHSRALVEERKRVKEEKRRRREANLKRREENRLKSEIVQVVCDTDIWIQGSIVDIETSYGLDGPRFEFWQGQEISSLKPSRLALVPTQSPTQRVLKFFPGCKAAVM